MSKDDIVVYLSHIRDISKGEGLKLDTAALTFAIDAINTLDIVKGNLVQIEAPNIGDSYIDDSLLAINKIHEYKYEEEAI